jgi:hypothetical protein
LSRKTVRIKSFFFLLSNKQKHSLTHLRGPLGLLEKELETRRFGKNRSKRGEKKKKRKKKRRKRKKTQKMKENPVPCDVRAAWRFRQSQSKEGNVKRRARILFRREKKRKKTPFLKKTNKKRN